MTDDLAALRAELERHRINMTITGGYAVSLLADTVDRIISALARAEAAERERDDALAEAASLHGAECIENAALRARAEALAEACRIFRTYGLRPHDVSGAAEWNRALELSVS